MAVSRAKKAAQELKKQIMGSEYDTSSEEEKVSETASESKSDWDNSSSESDSN